MYQALGRGLRMIKKGPCSQELIDQSRRRENKREREQIANKSVAKYHMIKNSEHSKDNVIRAILECNHDVV